MSLAERQLRDGFAKQCARMPQSVLLCSLTASPESLAAKLRVRFVQSDPRSRLCVPYSKPFCQDGFPAPRGSSDIAASGLRKLHRTDREKAAVSHHTSAVFTVYFPAAVY